jgi:hypothetical protein
MPRRIFGSCLAAALVTSTISLPAVVLVDDAFSDLAVWQDLSTAVSWGEPATEQSAFRLTTNGITVSAAARDYAGYGDAAQLKTFTCLDYRFDRAIEHASSVVEIDFQIRWEALSTGSGESNRFMIILNHAYPVEGLDLAVDTRVSDFSQAWWARPAYHLRMRGGAGRQATSMLQYGGGATELGEYEATTEWWLPGFISGAGGVPPGTAADFPVNSWVQSAAGLARTEAIWYRYRIGSERQQVYLDDNDDGEFSDNELVITMPLPASSEAPLYRWFEHFEGIRLYWRAVGGDQAVLHRLIVRVESTATSRRSLGISRVQPDYSWNCDPVGDLDNSDDPVIWSELDPQLDHELSPVPVSGGD